MTLLALIISSFVQFADAVKPYIKRGSFYAIISALIPVVYGMVKWIAFSTSLLTSRNVFGELVDLCAVYAPGLWLNVMEHPHYLDFVAFMFYLCGGDWMVWSWVSILVPLMAVAFVLKAIIAVVKFLTSLLA